MSKHVRHKVTRTLQSVVARVAATQTLMKLSKTALAQEVLRLRARVEELEAKLEANGIEHDDEMEFSFE
jgi:hypothetical protein